MTCQLAHDTVLVRKQLCTTDVMFVQEKGHQSELVYANKENLPAACTQPESRSFCIKKHSF